MTKEPAKHVLVVDDEEGVRRALKKILRKEGFDVESAGSAAEAMGLAQRKSFDLVITDMVMPGSNGMVLLSQLRAARPAPKVVLITSYGDWDSYLDAMNAGAFDYVTKPLKKDEIVRLVRHALEESGEPGHGSDPRSPRRLPT